MTTDTPRIVSRRDLRIYMACDDAAFHETPPSVVRRLVERVLPHSNLGLWFLRRNRRLEYLYNNSGRSPLRRLVYLIAGYRYARLQHRYCCSIPVNVLGPGTRLWHFAQGSIIINDQARIGIGFSISANCCVGQAKDLSPRIGDGVEMCVGSMIIGDIRISDRTTIGAHALVLHSVDDPNVTVAGTPAREISRNYDIRNERRCSRICSILAANGW